MASKIGTRKDEVGVFTCPVCKQDVSAEVTFRIEDKGTKVGENGQVVLNLDSRAVGLNLRHKCDIDTQEGPPEPTDDEAEARLQEMRDAPVESDVPDL